MLFPSMDSREAYLNVMPGNLAGLIATLGMKCFDPMIAYNFAMPLAAALLQRRATLRINNANDTELSLYFLTVAKSGGGKGKMSAPILSPLHRLVRTKREEIALENEERRAKNAALNAVIAAKTKQSKRLSRCAVEALVREIAELKQQIQPEIPPYIFDVQDVTTPSLMQDLAEQDGSGLFIVDTEGRFLRSLIEDKPLSSLLNQAFMGESVNNRRVSGKSVAVDNPHLSIAAAIQPDKLDRLCKSKNLWGEGFIPRTLPYFAEYPTPNCPAIGEIDAPVYVDWWNEIVEKLFLMPLPIDIGGRPTRHIIQLSPGALSLYQEWAKRTQQMKQSPEYNGLESNLSRLPDIAARIAAVYHCLESPCPFFEPVSQEMMQLAINIINFPFIPHILRLNGVFNPTPYLELIPKICDWLKSRIGTKEFVTQAEIYANCGSKKDGCQNAIFYLCNHDILRPICNWIEHPGLFGNTEKGKDGFLINYSALHNFAY